MKTNGLANDQDQRNFQAQLREIVIGLKHHLEEEQRRGWEGWDRSPASPKNRETVSPLAPGAPSPADLETIKAELGDCRRCKLHSTRTQIVFGTGDPRAKLLFVGEAPGREEDLQGEPFVGQAGQLLNKIIQAMQLRREQVYIGNIVKCRPPENRNPEPDEIMACEPFLIKQIQAIRPKLICALGAFAAQTLLKTEEKISSLRGKFHAYQGIPLMPTYHPAYLLRNPNRKREVWEDMKKIKREYDQV
jgi:DNA polymerase